MKCAQCGEDKPTSDFSKSQLKKGAEAKCTTCCQANAAAANATTTSTPEVATPTPKGKICFQCKQPNKQFSKSHLKRDDGKCTDCVDSQGPTVNSPQAPSQETPVEKETETPVRKETEKKASNVSDDNAEEIRLCCESCEVFKPEDCFDKGSDICTVCAQARKSGTRQTTMKDHGLVRADGQGYRRLSWVPDNLKEYLVFMNQEGNNENDGRQEEEEGEEE